MSSERSTNKHRFTRCSIFRRLNPSAIANARSNACPKSLAQLSAVLSVYSTCGRGGGGGGGGRSLGLRARESKSASRRRAVSPSRSVRGRIARRNRSGDVRKWTTSPLHDGEEAGRRRRGIGMHLPNRAATYEPRNHLFHLSKQRREGGGGAGGEAVSPRGRWGRAGKCSSLHFYPAPLRLVL